MDDTKKNWWMEIDHQSDVDTLEGSKEAKELLLECDDVELPEDDEFFNNLHNKIMAGVEVTKLKKDTRTFRQKHKKTSERYFGGYFDRRSTFGGTRYPAGESDTRRNRCRSVRRDFAFT